MHPSFTCMITAWLKFFSFNFVFLPYAHFGLIPTSYSVINFFSVERLYFNRSFLLWHRGLHYSSIKYFAPTLFRDSFAKSKRFAFNGPLKADTSLKRLLNMVYLRKFALGRWFFTHRLPFWKRTPLTEIEWDKHKNVKR